MANNVPDFLKNDPTFQSLPPDMQAIAVYNYNVQVSNNTAQQQALANALEQAVAQADPYWKNIVMVAQAQVLQGIQASQGDYQAQIDTQNRLINNINNNLASNKEYFTLEQQANLASLSADLADKTKTFQQNVQYLGGQKAFELQNAELDYQKSVDDIERNANYTTEEKNAELNKLASEFKVNFDAMAEGKANAGLTFSTKRQIAETRLKESNQGMVESTMRQYNKTMGDLASNLAYTTTQNQLQTGNINAKYNYQTGQEQSQYDTAQRLIKEERAKTQRDYAKQIADLEGAASSGNVEAQAKIQQLQTQLKNSTQQQGLEAEKYLGTSNLPTIPGYQPLGNVTGKLYEDQVKDVEQRKQAILNEMTQNSLTTL